MNHRLRAANLVNSVFNPSDGTAVLIDRVAEGLRQAEREGYLHGVRRSVNTIGERTRLNLSTPAKIAVEQIIADVLKLQDQKP